MLIKFPKWYSFENWIHANELALKVIEYTLLEDIFGECFLWFYAMHECHTHIRHYNKLNQTENKSMDVLVKWKTA